MADEKVLSGDGEDGKPLVDDVAIIETDSNGKPIESASDEDSRISSNAADAADKGEQRERKRETHQERRERHRKARERDQREMTFLRGYVGKLEEKVDTLSKQTHSTQSQSVDQRLSEALTEIDTAERIMAAAVDAKNGTDLVKAQRMRDEAKQRAMQLAGERERLQVSPSIATSTRPEPPPYLPLAQKFAEDKPWFTWDQSDEDSKLVLQIDNEVARAGYNPTTPAYWQELERRVQSKLPHRFNGDDDEDDDDGDQRTRQSARRGPPVGAGRQHAPPSTRHEAFISPERKSAMQEAGVWDDPVLRRKYAKAYSEWDRNNSARR